VKFARTLCALFAAVATSATPALAASRGTAGFTVAVTQHAAANVSIGLSARGVIDASGVLSAGPSGAPIVAVYATDAQSIAIGPRAHVSSVRDERGTVTVQIRLPDDNPGALVVASAT